MPHSYWIFAGTSLLFGLSGTPLWAQVGPGPREHSSGRPLPALPPIKAPVMFNTPEADRILAAMQVFPADNAWNEDISARPVHPNSKNIIASAGADKTLRYDLDMSFIIVPPDQNKVPVKVVTYPDESDLGPYPLPDNAPIEDWPLNGKELKTIQREGEGDRHVVVVDPVNAKLYELYIGRKTDMGWQAAQSSLFDLKSNKLRPAGWTSTDAAGLPIFPAIIRYDELERGLVEHAMRFTVTNTRNAHVYPATHHASNKTDVNLPRMGERYRLRADFDTTGFSPHARAILKGLQKYGMIMADNGGDWRLSGRAGQPYQGSRRATQGERHGFRGHRTDWTKRRAAGRTESALIRDHM